MPTTPTRGARRWRLIGTPMAVAVVLGAGGVLTACQPTPPPCFGKAPTIIGTAGNDRLDGTDGADVIVGLGGDDEIAGFGGADLICGGAGADVIEGLFGRDKLDGEAGSDRIQGGVDADTIVDTSTDPRDVNDMVGNAGDDVFQGGGGRDRIDFWGNVDPGVHLQVDLVFGTAKGDGNDQLRQIDAVIGGPGDDTLIGDEKANGLDGRSGDDAIYGYDGNDNLIGGPGDDYVHFGRAARGVNANLATGRATGEGNDRLSGIEDLYGSIFDDVLVGDARPNDITGLAGTDTCTGGGGADRLFDCP